GSATARLSPRRGWKRLLLTCLRVLGLTPPGYELSLLRSLRNCRARPDPRRAQYKGKPLYTPTGRRAGPPGGRQEVRVDRFFAGPYAAKWFDHACTSGPLNRHPDSSSP